ncbi:proline-rich extensin-like protein EPR1 [Pistacia vera]|uniref:proline-rich extensin-like protein EPR1 n=1 Tax=Pistacia vera TaxID=55513 RepID=UPI001262E40E|nr:proline-rich extensin-like protein EPR1 [Pistacia vera]
MVPNPPVLQPSTPTIDPDTTNTDNTTTDPPDKPLIPPPSSPLQAPTVLVHRSTRQPKPPIWVADYECPTISDPSTPLYPTSNYVTYDRLSPIYRACISNISAEREPTSYSEVVQHSH